MVEEDLITDKHFSNSHNLLSKRSVLVTPICVLMIFFFPPDSCSQLVKEYMHNEKVTEDKKKEKKILTLSICYRVYNCINTDAKVATFLTYC